MTDLILSSAQNRAAEIRTRMKRFKLIFIQCGAAFDILREPLLGALGGTVLNAADFAGTSSPVELPTGPVILDGIEAFAHDGKAGGVTLGALRAKVNKLRDIDAEICLVSRMPKISFAPVAGSSLLDDASWHCLPLLEPHERPEELRHIPASSLPSVGLGRQSDLNLLLRTALEELGVNVLTDLDFAVFEANHGASFITEVEPGVAEAMRGAGLAYIVDGALRFNSPGPFWQFKNAVADVIATIVGPQADLPAVSEGLWQIERTIRRLLREAAIRDAGAQWRKNLFNETIAQLVLERARNDVNVTAWNVSELRDPIEWLTLGELLQVVESAKFKGLSWDGALWRRFRQDVMPIRNRVSHLRLLKKRDRATVRMWVNRITTTLS
ncbi:hypothetical protein [Saccharopolyspora spinosa]|uniref:Swt1-like HEPN domain-containing protein n=1 Tax=Saccharopolyspora spinosa TaxID=60894 RepID=A0A2N3Y5V1_SACSN|nr:hypothetical protein [Saccharopolyspora spinosa]PKW18287.1 hypothetical protein A8926_6359 [Saccharopolyspora spinosa]